MVIQHISGKSGFQYVLEKALENKEKLLRSALKGEPLVYFIDPEFAQKYMETRKERGIHLKSLRFTEEQVDKPEHTNYEKYNKEVRVTNDALDKSILIWDDFVAKIDTEKMEGTITHNAEYANEKRRWFDSIWETST